HSRFARVISLCRHVAMRPRRCAPMPPCRYAAMHLCRGGDMLLSTILWLPIAAAVLLVFFPRRSTGAIKVFGFAASLATFVISLGILPRFSDVAGLQLVEQHNWIPQWG